MATKVEIIKGTVRTEKEVCGKGKVIEVDDKEVPSLIAMGIVKKAGGGKTTPAANPTGGATQ